MTKEMSWIGAITFGLISSVLSLVIFLLYQVFMADILLTIITTEYESGTYHNSNLILLVGLMLILTSSLLVNIIFFRNFSLKTRILSNITVFILTILILFVYAWISIILVYSEEYQKLTLGEQFSLMPYFFIILSAYILPNPVIFWIIGLITYHMFLIVFIKFFYKKKKSVSKIYSKKKKKSKIDINKYSMI